MKYLIVFVVLSAAAVVGCGCSSAAGKASAVKSPTANAQFKGSDHMPPAALAAKKAAGY